MTTGDEFSYGSPEELGHLEVVRETGSVLCRIAAWDCFGTFHHFYRLLRGCAGKLGPNSCLKTVPWCYSDSVSCSYFSKASKSAFLSTLNMADTYIEPWQLHSLFQGCNPFGSFGLRGGSSECGNGRKLKRCYLRILNTNLYLGSMPLLSHAY